MSSAESPIPEPPYPTDPTPPVTLVLTILLLVMFFVGFFSIYFCRCFLENIVSSLNNRQTPSGTPINPTNLTPPGLDSSIVNSFPTFSYSSVKDYRREKYGLECAICLCEFDDSDILRLLTTCCHVFHQECIDLWFESHKSCPVCRRNLDMLEVRRSFEKFPTIESARTSIGNNNDTDNPEIIAEGSNNNNINNNNCADNDSISLAIKEDANGPLGEGLLLVNDYDQDSLMNEKFSRSHSTGHSIFRQNAREHDDKYTLKLPQHVKDSITRRHLVTLSCTTFGEYATKLTRKHEVFGEISGSSTKGDIDKV